jgi:chemotaxis protein CheZ
MPAVDRALRAQLEAAHRQSKDPLTREQVAEIITEVVGSMEGDVSAIDLKLYHELESLAGYIQAARAEIAAIRPDEIREDYINSATDELDAVVNATEDATGRILDAAEQIQTVAGELDAPVQDRLIELVTAIFEASNFQDITGQRISKVVKTLKHIEQKIETLVQALGEEVGRAKLQSAAEAGAAAVAERELLNGPQLPSEAIDQSEIDRLLASFD